MTSSSRAPGSARRSGRPMRTPRSRRSTWTRPSTGRRWSSSPPPTSPATTSSARSRRTSRSWSRSAARSSTMPSRSRCWPLRIARRCVPPAGQPTRKPGSSRRSSIPLRPTHVFASYELGTGELDAAFASGRPRPGRRVPGRPPGAALHREQRDDREPGRRRRGNRHGLAPVPVLRAWRAQARARPRRAPRPA